MITVGELVMTVSGHHALCLALDIADATVRSEIELYAQGYTQDGHPWYCLDKPEPGSLGKPDPEADARALVIVDRAFRYIELRGDVFDWRIERDTTDPRCVRFVEKGAQS